MKYEILESPVSLADPEAGFHFSGKLGEVRLSFRDWQDRPVDICFSDVCSFKYVGVEAYKGLPEGAILKIVDSFEIKALREQDSEVVGDHVQHFIVSTNEGEWCEVIAGDHRVLIP